MTTTTIIPRPVVLIYIDGDSYGGDPVSWAGIGEPIVVIFDGGRYDKYNYDPSEHDGGPRESYEEDLKALAGYEAHDTLLEWIESIEQALGIAPEDYKDERKA